MPANEVLETGQDQLSTRVLFGHSARGRALADAVAPSLDRVLAMDQVRSVYRDVLARDGGSFCERVLDSLGISASISASDLEHIPASGPVILAANHPLGAIDGLLLLAIARRVRGDVKLMANRFLGTIPELLPDILPVDVFGPGAPANLHALRHAMRWLRDGGCLATFPAGEVSCLRFRDGEVSDGPWSPSIAMLARKTGASVVPVCFEARNSWVFQTLGRVHPIVRTCLLPREMLRKRGSRISLRTGAKVDAARLASFPSDAEAAANLRVRTYLLSGRAEEARPASTESPIAPPVSEEALRHDVHALPPGRTLMTSGALSVKIADAAQIPNVLAEIGRLREATFRAVGEGTGTPSDIDHFDATYRHLFVWDDVRSLVVGAYRLGLTDELCARGGTAGLYTATLFRYRPSQLQLLMPGIELGRSFIRAEYQRDYLPLLLLWQGIGRFVSDNPRYRFLFGTASISESYPSLTRKLLVRFLTAAFGGGEFARLAEPTTPPRFERSRERETQLACRTIHKLEDADELVSSIDPHGRGIPILLRQYLRLGAKLIGFNVDPAFGNALDGLIVVDLTKAPSRLVARYMGRERYQAYLQYHGAA